MSEFLQDYALAFSAGDVEEVANFYDMPLSMIHPTTSALVTDRERLIDQLTAIHDVYAAAGMGRVRATSAEEVGFDDGMGMLNVRWALYRRGGGLMTTVATTYVLRHRDGQLRIAGVIAHNEAERRGALALASRRARSTR
ncbi:MAG: DUF4440 domain-containing protein [Pseudomonadota bacterium]